MTKEEFLFHLQGSSYVALKFAEKYVKTELKTNFKCNVLLNIGFENPNLIKTYNYKEDNAKMVLDIIDIEVVDLLYREGKVPVWIDINVLKSSRKSTTFNLMCSGKYSDNKDDYSYNHNGSGPFGVKSPKFPIGYIDGKKFKL